MNDVFYTKFCLLSVIKRTINDRNPSTTTQQETRILKIACLDWHHMTDTNESPKSVSGKIIKVSEIVIIIVRVNPCFLDFLDPPPQQSFQ